MSVAIDITPEPQEPELTPAQLRRRSSAIASRAQFVDEPISDPLFREAQVLRLLNHEDGPGYDVRFWREKVVAPLQEELRKAEIRLAQADHALSEFDRNAKLAAEFQAKYDAEHAGWGSRPASPVADNRRKDFVLNQEQARTQRAPIAAVLVEAQEELAARRAIVEPFERELEALRAARVRPESEAFAAAGETLRVVTEALAERSREFREASEAHTSAIEEFDRTETKAAWAQVEKAASTLAMAARRASLAEARAQPAMAAMHAARAAYEEALGAVLAPEPRDYTAANWYNPGGAKMHTPRELGIARNEAIKAFTKSAVGI